MKPRNTRPDIEDFLWSRHIGDQGGYVEEETVLVDFYLYQLARYELSKMISRGEPAVEETWWNALYKVDPGKEGYRKLALRVAEASDTRDLSDDAQRSIEWYEHNAYGSSFLESQMAMSGDESRAVFGLLAGESAYRGQSVASVRLRVRPHRLEIIQFIPRREIS